jgi:hypothetical protein
MLAKSSNPSQIKTGEGIITGGLVLQVLFFGFFIVLASIFHYRISLLPTSTSLSSPVPWKNHLTVLYMASTLILVRSLFRIVEYIMGNDGPLLRTEAYLYVFDGTLMFVTMGIFAIWHPSQIIAGRMKESECTDVEMTTSL